MLKLEKEEKFIAVSALIAALYVVLTLVVAPFAYGVIQFRISEMLNQLVVYNKKYIWGIALGCAIANLFSGNGMLDFFVGTAATLLGLSISIFSFRFIKSRTGKYISNTLLFSTIGMLPIALMLLYLNVFPKDLFLMNYVYLIVSELIIMGIGMFIMPIVNHRLNFEKLIEK